VAISFKFFTGSPIHPLGALRYTDVVVSGHYQTIRLVSGLFEHRRWTVRDARDRELFSAARSPLPLGASDLISLPAQSLLSNHSEREIRLTFSYN
jgi:hypothetical protein